MRYCYLFNIKFDQHENLNTLGSLAIGALDEAMPGWRSGPMSVDFRGALRS